MPREYGTLFFLQDLNGGFFHSFNERVGHPEKLNQSLGVKVLE
jgi:hypothetical protein